MAIQTICPDCGARFNVAKEALGKTARCAKCQAKFRIASGRGVAIAATPPSPASPAARPPKEEVEEQAPLAWTVGDVISNLYEVTDLLGEGGMGKVYKVHHREWNMDLAVKSPKPSILEKVGGVEDFEREAEVWVNLGLHPHVVSCHYVRRLGGIPRVFAEYVDGGSLEQWIAQGLLYEGGPQQSLKRILDVAIQFAWGLHYAHEQGLVHQDVKPANVMMATDGTAKVTDFGLAKARDLAGEAAATKQDLTQKYPSILVSSGGMTPAYCSPEQADRRPLTRKTDIWSWAVSILEMFTGEVTWLGGQVAAEALDAYLADPAACAHPRFSTEHFALPLMPSALATVIRQCLQRNPAARPGDMLQIAVKLEDVYGTITGTAYPRPMPKPADALADSLNNRAASLLDLGRQAEAERHWGKALEVERHHIEATYNRGLLLWRTGRLSDSTLVEQLREVATSHGATWRDEYLLGLVHLERGNPQAAVAVLEQAVGQPNVTTEVIATLERARQAASSSTAEMQVLTQPQHRPSTVWVDAGGQVAVSAGWDGDLRTWNLYERKCSQSFTGHRGRVNSLAVDLTGNWCLTGGDDDRVRLWNLAGPGCVRTITNGAGAVNAVALTADRRFGLAGGPDGGILVWDLRDGSCVRTLRGHRFHVLALAVSDDGRLAFSGGRDRTVRIWDLVSGALLQKLEGHQADISAVAINVHGTRAVSASHDGMLRLWDIPAGTCVRVLGGHTDWIRSVTVDANGAIAVSGGSDRTVRMWDLNSGVCLRTLSVPDRDVTAVAMSGDASLVLSCGGGDGIHVWRLGSRGERAPFVLSMPLGATAARSLEEKVHGLRTAAERHLGEGDYSQAAQVIARAREIPGYRQNSGLLKLLGQAASGGRICGFRGAWQVHMIQPEHGRTLSLAPLPHGDRFLNGQGDGTVCLWSAEEGKCLEVFQGHSKPVRALAVSADGRRALSSAEFPDRELRVWDLAAGQCLRVLEAKWAGATSLGLSHDGRYAVTNAGHAQDKRAHFYAIDLESGNDIQRMDADTVPPKMIALCPDGELIAASGWSPGVALYDLNRHGWRRHSLEGHSGAIACLAFSPEGRRLLSGSADRTLRIWDVETAALVRSLEGHSDWISCLAVSPDGQWALSGSNDGTIRLWKLATGDCARTFEGASSGVVAVAFSSDSRFALSVGSDGTLRIWQLDWELEFPGSDGWDEAVIPYLRLFLSRCTPLEFGWSKWQKTGPPRWGEAEFRELMADLKTRGFGWLRPERVRQELEKMAADWTGPPLPIASK
jgi:WD40 repeat protein/serine/threonine protein kinase